MSDRFPPPFLRVMRVIAGNVSTNVRDFAERKNIAKPGIAKKSAGKETCPAITRITRAQTSCRQAGFAEAIGADGFNLGGTWPSCRQAGFPRGDARRHFDPRHLLPAGDDLGRTVKNQSRAAGRHGAPSGRTCEDAPGAPTPVRHEPARIGNAHRQKPLVARVSRVLPAHRAEGNASRDRPPGNGSKTNATAHFSGCCGGHFQEIR